MFVKVSVVPGAKKEVFSKRPDSSFQISVREPAKQNLANTRVRELLALHFRTDVKAVRILTGHRSPKKLISIN